MNEFFDKEEWANRKQQDRESAYAMVDDALKKVGTDGKAFQTYLDVQSKFERYSVSNALLVAAQKPDATDLGEANFWRGRGGYIRKGESGILLMEPGNSYTRKDGSKGVGINVKRVFDISQTTLSPVPERVTNPERSHCYNPFVYLRDDDDIQRLATNIMKNTTPKDSKSSDHFWEDMAAMLLKALISYLHYEAPPEEQNFPMVMDMIRAGDVKEDNEEYVSTLDELFERLERRNPEHIAVRYYKGYHSGSGKTLKSIQITLISHLEKFNLTSLAGITQTDEMELGEIGERKTAVFAVIPDSDSSYNFIVGMLYTQLFQQLYRKADFEHGGRLPVHVHFVMDEFANGVTRSTPKTVGITDKSVA